MQRYLDEFAVWCKDHSILTPEELTPEFLRNYADERCKNVGPTNKKPVIWTLRKFGKFLSLLQLVSINPVREIKHPKFHPGSDLPE